MPFIRPGLSNWRQPGRMRPSPPQFVLCCPREYIRLLGILLGNDSVNTFPREPTRATIGRLLLGNGSVNTPEKIQDNIRRCFPWGPPRDYVTRSSKGAASCQKLREFSELVVVKKCVDFCRWKSKMIEKKWEERN
jgi:hypothetical protein